MVVTVLVTGFEPYLEYTTNPTQEIATLLDGKEINGISYSGAVLPVDYTRLEDELLRHINDARPSLIIGTGLAPGRAKISLEKIAINYMFSKEPDNSGRKASGERIDRSLEDGIFSLLSVEKLSDLLNSLNIPAEVSLSAGAYLCNYAMFIIVREARKLGIKGGFVHFPADTKLSSVLQDRSLPSMELETMLRAVKIISEYEASGRASFNA